MTRKRRRLYVVIGAMVLLSAATALVIGAFRDNLVFFFSPTELVENSIAVGQRIRIGGLVEDGSFVRDEDGLTVHFSITDLNQNIRVSYRGILPSLFREGQGVIVQGRLENSDHFIADEVMAKHDENYMPPEVADALKKSGKWKGKPE